MTHHGVEDRVENKTFSSFRKSRSGKQIGNVFVLIINYILFNIKLIKNLFSTIG